MAVTSGKLDTKKVDSINSAITQALEGQPCQPFRTNLAFKRLDRRVWEEEKSCLFHRISIGKELQHHRLKRFNI